MSNSCGAKSVASEADMKPGNRKGTNPGPPERTRRTRRTAIVLRTPPRVLNSTAVHCDPPFGTKRPQVQILSPRPCFRRPEALTRVGEGLSCCPYRSKIPQVPQQIRTFELLITWVPPAGAALRWDEEAAAQILSPRTEFWRVISEGKCRKEHSKTGLASETSTHSRSTRTPPVRWRSCAWGKPARLETVWLGGKERPASTDQVRGFCDLLRDQTPADQTAAG